MRDLEKRRASNRRWDEANPEKVREYKRRWRQANPEKQQEYQRRYRDANPERFREQERLRSQKWRKENPDLYRVGLIAAKLGISHDEVRRLRAGTHCAACGLPREGRMVIDHCHETGKVRGFIHNKCNIGIAHAKDSPDTAWNWSHYLTRHSFDLRDLCAR